MTIFSSSQAQCAMYKSTGTDPYHEVRYLLATNEQSISCDRFGHILLGKREPPTEFIDDSEDQPPYVDAMVLPILYFIFEVTMPAWPIFRVVFRDVILNLFGGFASLQCTHRFLGKLLITLSIQKWLI